MKTWKMTIVAMVAILGVVGFVGCGDGSGGGGNGDDPSGETSYTVTFDLNYAGAGTPPVAQIANEDNGFKITEPSPKPTRVGYDFGEWCKDEEGNTPWNFEDDTITEDMTLYALWIDISAEYTVSFDLNYEGSGTPPESQTVNHAKSYKATAPSAPERTGYTFDGWWDDDVEPPVKWEFADIVHKDLSLTAHWIIKQYTVTFNSNGGSNVSPITEVNHGSTVNEPAAPTKEGYEFAGWYKEATLTNAWGFDTSTVTANTTIYAKWEYDGSLDLGDTGPGGGKIFYRSEEGFTMTDTEETCHYLEAAPADMDTYLSWSTVTSAPYPEITGTATAIGTGRKNTALILVMDTTAPAAKACNEYTNNEKIDWFLPSIDELNELYENITFVGNLDTGAGIYWSSSRANITSTVYANKFFYNGEQTNYVPSVTIMVRAIRAF